MNGRRWVWSPERKSRPRVDLRIDRMNRVYRILVVLFAGGIAVPSLLSAAVIRGPHRTVAVRSQRVSGQLYVPFSAVVEAYGLFGYDYDGRDYLFRSRECRIILSPSSSEVEINGLRLQLDSPVKKIDGQLFVPIYLAIHTLPDIFPARPRSPLPVPEPRERPPLIVIDPGHGGEDTGAIGVDGALEKEVVLSISRLVRSLLEVRGYRVIMTRDGDIHVPLPSRVTLANAASGDLFVSIHSNAAANLLARGPETFYYASASDLAAAELARLENLLADPSELDGVGDIIESSYVVSADRIEESRKLAGMVQRNLAVLSPENDRGVRTARFFVLRHTRMPAILVEAGFLTNRIEAGLLADLDYQKRIAEAIASGIDGYLGGPVRKNR